MKKSVLAFYFIFWFLAINAQTNLVEYQYWFNDDFDGYESVLITPSNGHQLSASLDVSALPDGVNVYNVRYKDENNLYTAVLSNVFYKNTIAALPGKTLVLYEYWFNNAFDQLQQVSINAAAQHEVIANIDLGDMPFGVNVINFRYMDETGLYSTPLSKVFYKGNFGGMAGSNLVAYEYWFNNNDQNKQQVAISPAASHQLLAAIDVSALPQGVNVLNIRYKDSNNLYSSSISQVFVKGLQNTTSDNYITGYEYWLDDNLSGTVAVTLPLPLTQVSIDDLVDFTQIPKGDHLMTLRLKDSGGRWSSPLTDTVTKLSLPIAQFEINTGVYCDSTVMSTTNNSIDGDLCLWDFGDGNTSAEFQPVHTYTQPGDYTISLYIWDSLTGADSISYQSLTVETGTTYANMVVSACDSYTSPSGNHTWTSSGIWYDTIPNIAGCDSIIAIDLTIALSSYGSLAASACNTYTSPSGLYTWSVTGMYTDTLMNAAGCDSIITIDLTVFETAYASITASACDVYTSPSGNYTWTTSGVYADTLMSSAGCDSVITVTLTIHQTSYATLDESACNAYTSPSGNYTWNTSGVYNDTIQTSFGCDSILTINLSIIQVDTSVTVNDPVLTANALDATFQWLNCATMQAIEGATGQSFTPDENGWYAVEVTQQGCVDTSYCYQVLTVGRDRLPLSPVRIYPNPADHKVYVDFGRYEQEAKIQLLDLSGRPLLNEVFFNEKVASLKLNQPPGIYVLKVNLPGVPTQHFKIIKR